MKHLKQNFMQRSIQYLLLLILSVHVATSFGEQATKVVIPGYTPPTVPSPTPTSDETTTTVETTTTTTTPTTTTTINSENTNPQPVAFKFGDPKQTAIFDNFFNNLNGCTPGQFPLQQNIMMEPLSRDNPSVVFKIIGADKKALSADKKALCHVQILLSSSNNVELRGSDLIQTFPKINVQNSFNVKIIGRDCLFTKESIAAFLQRRQEILNGKYQLTEDDPLTTIIHTECQNIGELEGQQFILPP